MNKKQIELDKLCRQITKCRICRQNKVGQMVFGEGNPNAKIAFIGEAPGKTEAKTGRPFVGRSGQLLRQQIRRIGLREENVYITSPVKYLPAHGTPISKEIVHGREHLQKQLAIINPKLIVLLGRVAARGVLGEYVSVSKEHGKLKTRNGVKYFITIHPAAALRFPPNRKVFVSDFNKLSRIINTFYD